MDYEKKIRDYMNSSEVDQLYKSMLSNLFPELVEPQEEKARRSLLEFLEDLFKLGKNINFDRWSKADCGEWVNWVMKQGKQKPANSIWHDMTENPQGSENDRTLVVFEDGYSTTSNALLHIGFGTSKSYKWAYVNDILRLTSNAKLSEQKFKVGDIVRASKSKGAMLKIVGITDYCYNCVTCAINDEYSFGLDIQDEFELVEHKPADKVETNLLTVERAKEISPFMRSVFENEAVAWSDYDKEMMLHCTAAIRMADYSSFEDKEKMEKWLKDRVQPKPKQEWSEEDERTINDVIQLIEDGALSMEDKYYYIEKLKSLKDRFTWKPSEEQINALYEATLEGEPVEALETLLSDLKKLKD